MLQCQSCVAGSFWRTLCGSRLLSNMRQLGPKRTHATCTTWLRRKSPKERWSCTTKHKATSTWLLVMEPLMRWLHGGSLLAYTPSQLNLWACMVNQNLLTCMVMVSQRFTQAIHSPSHCPAAARMLPGAQSQALKRFQPKQHSEQSSSHFLPSAHCWPAHVRGVGSVVMSSKQITRLVWHSPLDMFAFSL